MPRLSPQTLPLPLSPRKVDLHNVTNGVVAETGWLTVVPDGFRSLLQWVSARYGRPIIMVTENGMDRYQLTSPTLARQRPFP